MSQRRLIGAKPTAAERWIAAPAAPAKAAIYTARLTIDVTPELRARLKLAAFTRDLTLAEMLRTLLENAFARPDGGSSTRGRRP